MNCSVNITPFGNKEQDTKFLEIIKKSGFTHIGIELNKTEWIKGDDWQDKVNALKEAIFKNDLAVSSVHLFHYSLDTGVTVKYPETEEFIKRTARAAFTIGTPFITAHPRSSMEQGFNSETAAKHNKEDFLPILELAEKNGTSLLFENMPVFPDFPDRRYFSSIPDEFAEFIDSFSSSSVGVCWDTGHVHMLLNEDEFDHMKKLGSRIKLIELNNNWVRFDSHMLPSQGNINWDTFAVSVKETDFTGDLVIDARPAKIPEIADAYYAHAYDCAKAIKERIEKA